jgi:hypothetical protein
MGPGVRQRGWLLVSHLPATTGARCRDPHRRAVDAPQLGSSGIRSRVGFTIRGMPLRDLHVGDRAGSSTWTDGIAGRGVPTRFPAPIHDPSTPNPTPMANTSGPRSWVTRPASPTSRGSRHSTAPHRSRRRPATESVTGATPAGSASSTRCCTPRLRPNRVWPGRPRLLPAPRRRRQATHGGHTRAQTAHLQRRVPLPAAR